MEHFGKFMEQMKEAVMKMRAKFIDHCHQMSGREWASGTLCTHVHVHVEGVYSGFQECIPQELYSNNAMYMYMYTLCT